MIIQRKYNFSKKKVKWNYELKYKYGFIKSNDDGLNIALKVNGNEIPQNEIQKFKALVGVSNIEAIWKNKRIVSKPFTIESRKYYDLNYAAGYFRPIFLIESMILPGLGQFQDYSKLNGIVYFVTSATFGYLYINENGNYKNYLEKYNSNKVNYSEALNEVQTVALRNIMEQSLNDVNTSIKKKNIFLGCLLGAYLINVIDAVIFHTEGFDMELIEVTNGNLGFNLPSIKFNYPLN